MNSFSQIMRDRQGNLIEERRPNLVHRDEFHERYAVGVRDVNRIKEQRARFGMSMRQVSNALEQHVTTIARHESRSMRIPVQTIETYATLFGVDMAQLYLDDDYIGF